MQFHIPGHQLGINPLVMVMHRNSEDLFRVVLTDHILIEDLFDLRRFRNGRPCRDALFLVTLLGDDVIA